MKLYVLRHADAESIRTTDAARELTDLGFEQARTVGEYCVSAGFRLSIILTSPYRRAMQTAEIVGAALGVPVQKEAFLASGMKPDDALAELKAYDKFAEVMIVGHQPDLGELIETLLGSEEHFPVGKATLTCLGCPKLEPGAGMLGFTRSVRQM